MTLNNRKLFNERVQVTATSNSPQAMNPARKTVEKGNLLCSKVRVCG